MKIDVNLEVKLLFGLGKNSNGTSGGLGMKLLDESVGVECKFKSRRLLDAHFQT